MSSIDGPPDDTGQQSPAASLPGQATDARLAALEVLVDSLREEVAALRAVPRQATAGAGPEARPAFVDPATATALRRPPQAAGGAPAHAGPQSFSDRMHSGAAISGVELESLVGRYGTLALAALVILMAVGAVIKMAVQHGLLTPEVRVIAGVVVAMALGVAGFVFRGRGEARFGGVLLALSLAVIDLVAWGAGPRFHLVPTSVALGIVDAVAIGVAALALHDDSEFLFAVAVAGALSAPFVTSDGGGTALGLLTYGGVVLAGALRSARNAAWGRAFAVLVIGALVYELGAAALPVSHEWYGPYLVALFGGSIAGAALLFSERDWRSELPRAYLAMTVVGVLVAWDVIEHRPFPLTLGVSLGIAGVTYGALFVRQASTRLWTSSALLLPFVSLGLAYAGAGTGRVRAGVFAAWTLFALAAWRVERAHSDDERAGAHLLAAAYLGCFAVTAWLWDTPLAFVAGLAGWGVVIAGLCAAEGSALPLVGVVLAVGGAAVSSIDQLASRSAYDYAPFLEHGRQHIKLLLDGYVSTSMLLIVTRGQAPPGIALRPPSAGWRWVRALLPAGVRPLLRRVINRLTG